jgi:crotonobetainyl-CoA:carnitine CoA-transferase CaiB-like acyl-CoA transferase
MPIGHIVTSKTERAMKPLENVRVLDLSRMVAGGLAGMLLADFGADVVKVEQPGVGDPLRLWTLDGRPHWWNVYARGKRYITLNFQSPEGRDILMKLLPRFDVLIESFIPGTMERHGLGWDVLHEKNPRLIMMRISGWGRTGPEATRPGFGTLVEAATGFAAMNGTADGPPILPSFPLADMASGLYAANAVMLALYHRDGNGGEGQCVDVSLFESLFSLLGPLSAEYAASGKVRMRQGNRSTNSGPRGCYRTADGYWIAVSASTPKMAERFLEAYGLGELLRDPRFATNEVRVRHAEQLDSAICVAVGARSLAENQDIIKRNNLTAHPVQTIAEIDADAHWNNLPLTVDVGAGSDAVRMPNVIPHLSATPGEIRWPGGRLGQHNEEIYCSELQMTQSDLDNLRSRGVI